MMFLTLQILISFAWAEPNPCVGVPELSSLLSRSYATTQSVKGCFRSEALQKRVAVELTIPRGYPFAEPIPSLYYLHGKGGAENQFRGFGGLVAMEQYLRDGGKPMIVIAPGERNHSYWKNTADGLSDTATMVTDDLISYIETHGTGRIATGSENRAVSGTSMGGNGALYLACGDKGYLFKAVDVIAPVTRGFDQLEDKDKPVFWGSTVDKAETLRERQANYRARDPRENFVSIFDGAKKHLPCDYHIRYATDDGLINETETRAFLNRLESVDSARFTKSRVGGHSSEYFKSQMPGLLRRVGNIFHPAPVRSAEALVQPPTGN